MALGSAVSAAGALKGMLSKPKTPDVPAPEKPPQASKSPEVAAVRQQNVSAPTGPGNSSTFLSGTNGVDPSTLSLGKSTLLGQ